MVTISARIKISARKLFRCDVPLAAAKYCPCRRKRLFTHVPTVYTRGSLVCVLRHIMDTDDFFRWIHLGVNVSLYIAVLSICFVTWRKGA